MKTLKKLCQTLKGPRWIGLLLLLTGWFMATPAPTLFAQAATVSNQTVVAWGQNGAGQLNLPATLYNVKAIDAGYDHGVALKNDGTVVVWGNTTQPPAGLNNVVAVAAGHYGTLALKNDGTVVAWGNADYGQLTVPAGLSGVTGLAMGDLQSLAVKQDGTVVAWGNSSSGMAVPAGLASVVAVAASPTHNLALKRDGTVVAWGMPGSVGLNVPAGLNNVVAVVAGPSVDLALKSDGTVVAWGSSDRNLQPPAGLNNVIAIDINEYHAIALKRDGTVVKWGYAYLQSVPTYVSGATLVSLGYEYSVALVTDTTAPETMLSTAPAQLSLNPSVFGLSGTDNIPAGSAAPGLTFECSLDGSSFAACTSPVTYNTLLPGTHTFAGRAKDSAGNVDATPLSYTWKIEDCANRYNVVDEKSLTMGLACFKQYTVPGVYTLHLLNDINLSVTPVVENTTANVSLLIDGQNHAWDAQGHQVNGLQVKPGTTVTVQNLTIRNAVSPINNAGGVFNQGTLTLETVTVEGNRSPSFGGGIGNYGTLTVRNSTIRNNSAMGGGGIGNSQGTATIENSVIMGNSAAGAGGLYNMNDGTTTLRNVLFSGNSSGSGSEIINTTGSTINGTPTYVPNCYWVQNYQTGQLLTVPNQSNAAGTALVASAKATPTNGYQLWVRQGNNALSSLPTGQWLTVADQSVNGMTPAVIQPQTPGAANQSWVIPGYGDGAISFNRQLLNSYALAPIDQTAEQTPVVLRSPDDFRYNNAGNGRNKWWLVQASPLDCLAALPAQAASAAGAPAITQSAAPLSPEQAPADAQANLQRLYLPLVNK